jgi:hypothetical protein
MKTKTTTTLIMMITITMLAVTITTAMTTMTNTAVALKDFGDSSKSVNNDNADECLAHNLPVGCNLVIDSNGVVTNP